MSREQFDFVADTPEAGEGAVGPSVGAPVTYGHVGDCQGATPSPASNEQTILLEELRKLREVVTQQAAELAILKQNQQQQQRSLQNPGYWQQPDQPGQRATASLGFPGFVTAVPACSLQDNAEVMQGQGNVIFSSALPGGAALPTNYAVPNPPDPRVASNSENEWRQIALALSHQSSRLPLPERPSFRSPQNHHPVRFLQRFESYFRASRVSSEEKLEIVKGCLGGSAADWLSVRQAGWNNFNDFQEDFLNFFWSEERQHLERARISALSYSDKYDNMAEFFLRQVKDFQLFTPSLSEYTIVGEVMRQFPSHIQALWAVSPTHTIYGAVQFLERQSGISSKRQRGENKPARATAAAVSTHRPARTWAGQNRSPSEILIPVPASFPVPPPYTPYSREPRNNRFRSPQSDQGNGIREN